MTYLEILRANLVQEEGDRKKPYKDQFGNLTIGIGRNLTAKGISQDEEDLMFANDVNEAVLAARVIFPTFGDLSENRKAVLVDMAFNLGEGALSQFHGLIAAVADEDWLQASQSILNSRYAAEVPTRAAHLAQLMKDG